jgi:competence protein ComEA
MTNPGRLIGCAASVFLISASLAVGAQNTPAQNPPEDGHSNFPPGEGRELTIKVCSTCHSVDLLADQQLDRDGWKETVTQMASMGADATEEQLNQIIDYLAKAFPPPDSK